MLDSEERTKQAFNLYKHVSTLGTGLLAFTFGVEKFLPMHRQDTKALLCIFAISVFCSVLTLVGIVFRPTLESPITGDDREDKAALWFIKWFFRLMAVLGLFFFLIGIWLAVFVLGRWR